MRMTLIKRGLEAGRDELIRITKRYLLQVPILLLVLCNRKRGGPFLRAVLSILHENSDRAPGVNLINDVDTASDLSSPIWGRYIYNNPEERPDDEEAWYNLLSKNEESINDLIHFWLQFCMNWPILTDDLQHLSKATEASAMAGGEGASLLIFKSKYSILFECLDAVFGTMMSNSRLCEQIHGMMQHGLRSSVGIQQADHQRMFSTMIDYPMKEERRNMVTNTVEY